MVQWKGEIDEEAGQKARLLDELDGFNVPNFFVVEPEEVDRLFDSDTDPEKVLNSSINRSIKRELKEAYDEVGMSSEVREASGKAKSLVGGQRNSQLVSIRVSGSEKEKYTYKLNVGSSKFFEALREVVSSYYRENSDHPPVLVQKMVEPGFTGVLESRGREAILETVSGLGISLEEGLTKPHVFHLRNSRVQKVLEAEEQLEISRNPVRGENQRKKVRDEEIPFETDEVEEMARKARSGNIDLKFVYKRGGFHVVDAYRTEGSDEGFILSEEGVRAARGRIQGKIGQNVEFSDQTMSPSDYQDALIARKGGFTSRDGRRAREAGKPAILRYKGALSDGRRINLGPGEIKIEEDSSEDTGFKAQEPEDSSDVGENPFRSEDVERPDKDISEKVLATEVLPVDPRRGRGIFLKRKGSDGYSISETRTEATQIPKEGYLSSFEDVFAFEGESAVLDARSLPERGLVNAAEYLDAETKILLVRNPGRDLLKAAVESGFDAIGCPGKRVEKVSEVVAAIEKRFIMDRLRDL